MINETVRTYLINAARQKDKFVYYSDVVKNCGLHINTNTQTGRDQLANILGEISAFEDEQIPPRPLVSSLAIYKDRSKNDHGEGFYKLAARLGKGDKKKLRDELYAFSEAKKSQEFWQDEENYQRFANLNFSRQKSISDFFSNVMSSEKYAWIDDWHHGYMKFVLNIRKLRQNIINNSTLPIEDDILYKNLSDPFKGYYNFMIKWLKEKNNGISSRGQSVLSSENFERIIADNTFKIFAKAIILNPTLENFIAFSKWWYSNPLISNRPLLINRAFAACNPEILSSTVDNNKFWKVIEVLRDSFGFELTGVHNYNWFAANTQLTNWLDKELDDLLKKENQDKTAQLIWRNIFVWLIFSEFSDVTLTPNSLLKRERPAGGFDQFPENNPSFNGVLIDYEEKAKMQKDLGDAGEELVIQYEIDYLNKHGLHEKAGQVKIVRDGMGYDVLSFDKLGVEKYIEVKTTTGNALSRFYLSKNEVAFLRLNTDKYYIYRVYNYDEENNSGEFFELSPNVESQLLMQPTQYEVLLKRDV